MNNNTFYNIIIENNFVNTDSLHRKYINTVQISLFYEHIFDEKQKRANNLGRLENKDQIKLILQSAE